MRCVLDAEVSPVVVVNRQLEFIQLLIRQWVRNFPLIRKLSFHLEKLRIASKCFDHLRSIVGEKRN